MISILRPLWPKSNILWELQLKHHRDRAHLRVGLSPLVASRRPRGAERNGLVWKPVAEDHRTGVEGIET